MFISELKNASLYSDRSVLLSQTRIVSRMRTAKWMLISITVLLIIGGFLSVFRFRYKETAHPTIILREGAVRNFELELKKTVEVSGKMHGPSNPFAKPSVFEDSDWFYFDKAGGRISASEIVFTHWRACPDSLWWQKDMRGSIAVAETEVTIQLYMPVYDQAKEPPSRHVPWEHNGTYRVKRLQGTPAPVNSACGRDLNG